MPPTEAARTVSIFIADSTTIGSPALTESPTATFTSTTTPGIGAPDGADLGRVLEAVLSRAHGDVARRRLIQALDRAEEAVHFKETFARAQ